MAKVIYPITWLAGCEGEIADVLHDIADEMMEHRADLLRKTTDDHENESQVYLRQVRLFEIYATVLQSLYLQLEPEQWNTETSSRMLDLAKVHHILLPGWMTGDNLVVSGKQDNEQTGETTQDALNRFENEGGIISNEKLDFPIKA